MMMESQTGQATARSDPKFGVGQSVWILPAGKRVFMLAGDEDPDSPVHGQLIIVGIDRTPPDEPEPYTYRLRKDPMERETYFAPESGLSLDAPLP